MRRIVKNNELREKMAEAITLLCEPVASTLGPQGSNVIIDNTNWAPFITNDGVTIAESISSEDVVINTILEIAKEAAFKTNEMGGDGTSSTLVLLESIFKEGLEVLKTGVNPMVLKKELLKLLEEMELEIRKKSFKPSEDNLLAIASISANSKEMGQIITEAYLKVRNKQAIMIKEGNDKTIVKHILGYSLDTLIGSRYFFREQDNINLKDCKILITTNYVNTMEEIAFIVNYILSEKKDLVIMALDYSDDFMNEVIAWDMENDIKIVVLKVSDYGIERLAILNDIALITEGLINDSYMVKYLGNIKEININKEITTIYFDSNEKIKKKIKELKELDRSNEIEKDFINKRIAMLDTGLIEILVGDKTEAAKREKKMRYDDALGAIDTATKGVCLGSGLTLYEISEEKFNNTLISNSLKVPFKKIMYNAGLDSEDIIKVIKDSHYKKIYNVVTEEYELSSESEVLDATEVVINSLTYAISIASMLLTTSCLVINEEEKIKPYPEL